MFSLLPLLALADPAPSAKPAPAGPKAQQRINLQLQKGAPSAGIKIHHLSCYKDKASNLFLVSFKTDKPIQAVVKVFSIPRKTSNKPPILLATASEKKGKIEPDTDHSLVLEEVGSEPLALKKDYMLSIYQEGGK
jgi:hypothetical protein